MIWLDFLIVKRAVNLQAEKSSSETLSSTAPEPITMTARQATRVSAMSMGTKGCFEKTESTCQLVGRPQSKVVGPHAALESLDKLRLYQARAAAALEKKEYAGRPKSGDETG